LESLLSACLSESADGTLIRVQVQPRSSRNGIDGVHDDRLKIRLTAPPVEGEANQALITYLAKSLGIPKREVVLAQGGKSKKKVVGVPLTRPETLARLSKLV
jgi:uncharacterized protein (TIGR00251 family)